MIKFKYFLRKIDLFGAPFNFKYKKSEKYSTPLGGLIILIFIILSLAFGIYYLIPFLNRKNLSIIYYTMNLPKTEQIRLQDSKAVFAVGFDCDSNGRFRPDDVFDLESRHIIYSKTIEGIYAKDKRLLPSHYCKYEDFYNKYNKSFDYLRLKNYQCLNDYSQTIEGIYSDQVFSYYEFSVNAKNTSKEAFDSVDEYLSENDCKIQIVYTDITIDLSNYEEPIKPFLNSFFIQLSPILFIKRNVFFMNQYLYDDDQLLTIFNEEEKPKQMKTLFSRYEEYSLYLGLERESTRPLNYINYAKIYVRADIKKTDIRRTYQKLTEFYADASSLLIGLYDLLIILLSFVSNFNAEYSIIKKLFIFKGIDNKHFSLSQKSVQIKELLSLKGNINVNNKLEINNGKDLGKKIVSNDNNGMKIKLNNSKKIKRKKIVRNNLIKFNENDSSQKIYKILKISNHNLNTEAKFDQINQLNNINDNENIKNKIEPKNIKYSFNVGEIIASSLFPCCIFGNLKLKNRLNNKAIEFLYYKLDIIVYIRNMILFDLINNTMLDEHKIHIINFLSRPLLSLNINENNEKNDSNIFYQIYNEGDFDKFYNGYIELVKKQNKENREIKLVSITEQKLNELL